LNDPCPVFRVYEFDPSEGFEAFTMNVRRRIKAEGRDAFYGFKS